MRRLSGTDITRTTDWSKVKDASPQHMAILVERFVRGMRGPNNPRTVPVTRKQIIAWFRATPQAFIEDGIWEAIQKNLIHCKPQATRSGRRRNGVYVYAAGPAIDPITKRTTYSAHGTSIHNEIEMRFRAELAAPYVTVYTKKGSP